MARIAAAMVCAGVPGDRADVVPVRAVGDGEAVVLGQVGEFLVAVDVHGGGVFLVVDVGEALEEHEREDELLVVPRVDEAAQEDGGAPQVGLQFGLGDPLAAASWRCRHAFRPHLASSVSSVGAGPQGVPLCLFEFGERLLERDLLAVVGGGDVERDVQVEVVGLDVGQGGDVGEARLVGERLVRLQERLGVLGFEGVLVAAPLEQRLAVDEQHLALACARACCWRRIRTQAARPVP